jgi:hypothetical protein
MAKAVAKVAPKVAVDAPITKAVKIPLMVTMTGSKAALASEGEALISKLKESLPMTLRLGRGRKEVITIATK